MFHRLTGLLLIVCTLFFGPSSLCAEEPEGAIIGSPCGKILPKNPSDRNIDDPDEVRREMENMPEREHAYDVNCSQIAAESSRTYSSPNVKDLTGYQYLITRYWSLGVIYFVTVGRERFIYGALVNGNGFSDGEPIYVHAREWDCHIYRNWIFDGGEN